MTLKDLGVTSFFSVHLALYTLRNGNRGRQT